MVLHAFYWQRQRRGHSFIERIVHATTQITIAQVWEKGPHPLSSLARRLGFTAIQSKLCIIIGIAYIYRAHPHSPRQNPYLAPPQYIESTPPSCIPQLLNPPLYRPSPQCLATRLSPICPNQLLPPTPLPAPSQPPREPPPKLAADLRRPAHQ